MGDHTIFVNDKAVSLPITGLDIQRLAELFDSSALLLNGHLLCERLLDHFVARTVGEDILASMDLGFAQKLKLGRAVGLPDTICQFLTKLNKLRNKMAHEHNFKLGSGEIEELRNLSNAIYPDSKLKISDTTTLKFEGTLTIFGADIKLNASPVYGSTQGHQKLLIVIGMFLTKVVNFLSACDAIWTVLDANDQRRISLVKQNIAQIVVTNS